LGFGMWGLDGALRAPIVTVASVGCLQDKKKRKKEHKEKRRSKDKADKGDSGGPVQLSKVSPGPW
jgi:hypothetical protein